MTEERFELTNKIEIKPYAEGLLSSLKFAVKDNIDLANEITSNGNPSWGLTHPMPVSNAICVDQLLSAGATCVGKAQLDELAYSLIGINDFYKRPVNVKAPDRVTGGSSSVSASTVASGEVDFALGTDTGGSVRVPASNCGIWGYRPSHGLISVAGVTAMAPSFDTVGILAKSGDLLHKVIKVLLAEEESDIAPRVNICFLDDVFEMCNSNLLEAITLVTKEISKKHVTNHSTLAKITALDLDPVWLFEKVGFLLSTEIWNSFGGWVKHCDPQLSPGIRYSLENFAEKASRFDILNTLYQTRLFAKNLSQYLGGNNILCFPTTIDLAPKISDITPEFLATGDYYPRTMGVTAISGLSRLPEITVPLAQCNGIPIGLSFIAGYGKDLLLAEFCKSLSKKIQ